MVGGGLVGAIFLYYGCVEYSFERLSAEEVWRKLGLKISVVIRTRDTEKYFAELLEKLSSQTVRPSEIIIVDNFSSRENRQLLEERLSATMHRLNRPISSFRVIALSDSEFSHAYSTNLGVESAENDLV